jgi:choline dehydrogenase-like flavoprotein
VAERYDMIIADSGAGGGTLAHTLASSGKRIRRPRRRRASCLDATNDAEANGPYHEFRKILNHFGMAAHHVRGKNF